MHTCPAKYCARPTARGNRTGSCTAARAGTRAHAGAPGARAAHAPVSGSRGCARTAAGSAATGSGREEPSGIRHNLHKMNTGGIEPAITDDSYHYLKCDARHQNIKFRNSLVQQVCVIKS